MDPNVVVSFDAQTILVVGGLLLIGIVLAGSAMVILYTAWRAARRDHGRALAEIGTLRQELETERAAHAHDLETKQAELTALHAQFNATRADLTRTQTELESSNQSATHLQNRTQVLEQDLQDQRTRATIVERTLADQKLEIADLTNQLAQAETAQEKIAALETVLQTAHANVARLTDELAQAQEQTAQIAALESDLQIMRDTNARLVDELAQQKEQVAHLTSLAAARQADQAQPAEVQRLRVQVEEDQTKIAALNSRLNQARQTAERVISDLEQHKIQVAELTHQVHEAQLQTDELVALQSQVEQDKTMLNDLSLQLEQAREKAAQAGALETQMAKQQARAAELKSQLAVARKKAAPLTRLRKSAAKNRTTITELKSQMRVVKRQIKTLQAQSQKREAVIVDLTTRLYRIRQEAAENLQLVKGIGPTYAARLRAAGIGTVNALANTNATQLLEIIQPRRWQKPAFESWIKQAQRLSRQEKLKRK
jgi:chromosome segregation ATPase